MKIANLLVLLFMSCSTTNDTEEYTETFDNDNRPFFIFNEEKNQFLLEPWNYNLSQNDNRKYPLVIYLHGSGGAGDISYLNHLGYDSPDNNDDETAVSFQKNHPCFVLIPQTPEEWIILH